MMTEQVELWDGEPEPMLNDFDSDEEYLVALDEWEAEYFNCGQCLPCVGWGPKPQRETK